MTGHGDSAFLDLCASVAVLLYDTQVFILDMGCSLSVV